MNRRIAFGVDACACGAAVAWGVPNRRARRTNQSSGGATGALRRRPSAAHQARRDHRAGKAQRGQSVPRLSGGWFEPIPTRRQAAFFTDRELELNPDTDY